MTRHTWNMSRTALILAGLMLAALAIRNYPAAAEGARALPAPAVDLPPRRRAQQ